ncbi:MAG: cation transporter, partial [Anaerolineae bacterium]
MNKNENEELSCLEVIGETIEQEPGILNVDLDTSRELVAFDFDPEKVSPARVAQIAASLKPTLHKRWQTCTMRLGKTGGRACESCALDLERQLDSLPGVNRVTASYLGGVMSVTYDKTMVTPAEIARRVEQLGIPVLPSASETASRADEESLGFWLRRLQILFTAVTLIGMVGGWLAERAEAAPWYVTLLFTIAYLTGGAFGLKSSLQSLKARTIDIDLLMILAAVGAAIVGAPFEGSMLLFLFSLSNVLQDYALDRTRNAIRALMDLRPSTANVQKGSQIVTLPIERVNISDRVIVKPGERIPLDGVVLTGQGAVDQSSLTGESIPVFKEAGDIVFAGTINQDAALDIRVTKLARDNTLSRVMQMVQEAQSQQSPTQQFT